MAAVRGLARVRLAPSRRRTQQPDPAQQTGGHGSRHPPYAARRSCSNIAGTPAHTPTQHNTQNPTPQPAMPAAAQLTLDLAWHGMAAGARAGVRALEHAYQDICQNAAGVTANSSRGQPEFLGQSSLPMPKLPRRLPTPLTPAPALPSRCPW